MKEYLCEVVKFHHGELYDSFNYLGAHIDTCQGDKGVRFTVWAPNAVKIALTGTFNYWNDTCNLMSKITKAGLWTIFVPGIGEGEIYKYKIFYSEDSFVFKADPYGFYSELRPKTSSIVYNLEKYEWTDRKWIKKRNKKNLYNSPLNIYEIHLGSWMRNDNSEYLTYKELADKLVPYIIKMKYTHIEIMPIMEHPLDESWGYQITGFYSITSRYGKPEDLMYLINECHNNGIGVILDWVPGHFCRDEHGLYRFDGTYLYGGIDHPNWGTKKFDFTKPEIQNFLISNALFYFEKYHIDGIRVDGVASIVELNFGMDDKVYRNKYGGTDDVYAIEFLKKLNTVVFNNYPHAIMAAEDSTAWPLVTYPVDKGGLGFNFKWNMGWMNDTLEYIGEDPIFRKYKHDKITFSMHYAFTENFILPFSHDEVVHGKKTLIDKIEDNYENKFKTLKTLIIYQMTHPGKKLNFMGNEIAQFMEWRFYEEVEWFLLKYPTHDSHREFIKRINNLYLKERSLWELDGSWDGFEWIDVNNYNQSIYSYIRKSKCKDDYLIVILNFTPASYKEYRIGVPENAVYRVLLNSDELKYGGSGLLLDKQTKSKAIPFHGKEYSINVSLPGHCGIIFKKQKKE